MPASPDAAILRCLRAAGDAFTASSALGDPPAVAGRIEGLREAGYEIEHHPHLGYRLLSSPDRLIADDILSRLTDLRWIREITVFQSVSSTNDVVTGLGRDGARPGVVVFAEEQTAGRGRLGRRWQSDPRLGLWFSVLLRPEMPLAEWPRLTLWIAYAVAQAIRQMGGPEIMVKWPNDLYASGRKLAGILVETSLGRTPFATAGIGVNINQDSFPPPLDATATSLRIQTGSPFDRNAIAAAIVASIDRSFSLLTSDFQEILTWASNTDYLRGRWVSATAGSETVEGVAQGLDPDGYLLIRTAAGAVLKLNSGEVTRFSTGGQ
jgi:BirA family biotin operon repressor/biotin-[acetyl-CoA-carboxylase] ligase